MIVARNALKVALRRAALQVRRSDDDSAFCSQNDPASQPPPLNRIRNDRTGDFLRLDRIERLAQSPGARSQGNDRCSAKRQRHHPRRSRPRPPTMRLA